MTLSNVVYLNAQIELSICLELDITFVLDERCVPRHIRSIVRQLCEEVGMRRAVQSHELGRAIWIALIGIKESSWMSGSLDNQFSWCILAGIPWQNITCLQVRASGPRLTCPHLKSTLQAWARW